MAIFKVLRFLFLTNLPLSLHICFKTCPKSFLSPFQSEVGTCAAIIAGQACRAAISLAIALAAQLFLSSCADACAVIFLAFLSAIAQAQVKCDYE